MPAKKAAKNRPGSKSSSAQNKTRGVRGARTGAGSPTGTSPPVPEDGGAVPAPAAPPKGRGRRKGRSTAGASPADGPEDAGGTLSPTGTPSRPRSRSREVVPETTVSPPAVEEDAAPARRAGGRAGRRAVEPKAPAEAAPTGAQPSRAAGPKRAAKKKASPTRTARTKKAPTGATSKKRATAPEEVTKTRAAPARAPAKKATATGKRVSGTRAKAASKRASETKAGAAKRITGAKASPAKRATPAKRASAAKVSTKTKTAAVKGASTRRAAPKAETGTPATSKRSARAAPTKRAAESKASPTKRAVGKAGGRTAATATVGGATKRSPGTASRDQGTKAPARRAVARKERPADALPTTGTSAPQGAGGPSGTTRGRAGGRRAPRDDAATPRAEMKNLSQETTAARRKAAGRKTTSPRTTLPKPAEGVRADPDKKVSMENPAKQNLGSSRGSVEKRKVRTQPASAASKPVTQPERPERESAEPGRAGKPKVLRYARGEARKATKRRVGLNGAAPHPNGAAATPPAPPTPRERLSVAAQLRAAAEAQFSKIAPSLSTVAGEASPEADAPQHRGGPPQFHQSEFQIRFSEQDQLANRVRNARSAADAEEAASQLIQRFGTLPPDQALLTRCLAFSDDRILEKALDELLELDGRGKVRSTPELIGAVREIRSKSPTVLELVELLLEKLGAGSR